MEEAKIGYIIDIVKASRDNDRWKYLMFFCVVFKFKPERIVDIFKKLYQMKNVSTTMNVMDTILPA